jgi:glycosyltransferase involved in cell wall biosynthesis
MAAAGVRILTDDELHGSLSAAGRRVAEESFSTSAVVSQYEEFYERILAGGQT